MPQDDLQPGQTSKQFATIQEKNLQHLIKVMGTKEALDALTVIAKTEKNTWKDIAISAVALREFAMAGGVSGLKEEIKTIVQENVQGALGPLYNELQPIMNEVMRAIEPLMPFIIDIVKWTTDILVPIIQWIADTIQEIIDFFTGETISEKFGTDPFTVVLARYERQQEREGLGAGGGMDRRLGEGFI